VSLFLEKFQLLAWIVLLSSASLYVHPLPQAADKKELPVTTVRVGGDVKPPLKTKNVAPVYPPVALQLRVQGVVILEVTIGTDGKVKDVKVARSVNLLDSAAVQAVRGWEYKPTIVNGQPVQVIMTVPIVFMPD
jgi:protein TonB